MLIPAFIVASTSLLPLISSAQITEKEEKVSDTKRLMAQAQIAVANRNWEVAEEILTPLALGKNVFAMYELAQVYEHTQRVSLAKQTYEGLIDSLQNIKNPPSVIIRAPGASRMVTLESLAQTRLNAINPEKANSQTAKEPVSVASNLAPAAVPNPKNTPVLSRDSFIGVSTSMRTWATAWANKNMVNYYASYTKDFRGTFASHEQWKQQRVKSIFHEKNIRINFQNIQMTPLSQNQIQVRFLQNYASDILNERVQRTLVFVSNNGRWLIERETTD